MTIQDIASIIQAAAAVIGLIPKPNKRRKQFKVRPRRRFKRF